MDLPPLPPGTSAPWIGTPILARTTFDPANPRPMRWFARVFAGLALGGVGAFLGQILGHNLFRVVRVPSGLDDIVHLAILGTSALLGLLLAQLFIKPKQRTVLVGTEGVAIVHRKGKKDDARGLRFDQVARVDVHDTAYQGNLSGAYKGSMRRATFRDASGQELLRLAGVYEEGRPGWEVPVDPADVMTPENSIAFVRAAVDACERWRAARG